MQAGLLHLSVRGSPVFTTAMGISKRLSIALEKGFLTFAPWTSLGKQIPIYTLASCTCSGLTSGGEERNN